MQLLKDVPGANVTWKVAYQFENLFLTNACFVAYILQGSSS